MQRIDWVEAAIFEVLDLDWLAGKELKGPSLRVQGECDGCERRGVR